MSCSLTTQRTNIGVKFIVTVKDECSGNVLDISSAVNVKFIFRKPDATILTVNGSFLTDGTDGKIQYVSVSGDIDQSGYWKIQNSYNLGSSYRLTSIESFSVLDNLVDL